jgi:cytochrome c-type biogenesis protein CcmH
MLVLLFAVMTLVSCAVIAVAYWRAPQLSAQSLEHDIEVYAAQLRELDRDVARGTLSAEDMAEAKAELGRKILALQAQLDASEAPKASANGFSKVATFGAILAVPVLALGLYGEIGNPALPDQPIAARSVPLNDRQQLETLIAKAEAHLVKNPQDARGWTLLAPVYMRLGEFSKSADAFAKAIEFGGASAQLQNGRGEALMFAADGMITPKAEEAFKAALQADPNDPLARYYLARAALQAGRTEEGIDALTALRTSAPQGAPWIEIVDQAIASAKNEGPVGDQLPGPTAQDVAAAQDLSVADRSAMINGMVEQLSARLQEQPDDPAGWQRLIRSYSVLGRGEEAKAALRNAMTALAGNVEGLAQTKALAQSLGLQVEGDT